MATQIQKASATTSSTGLKSEVLSATEVLGQSVGAIAPSATPALVIPLVFATAGNGTWLAYAFGTIAILLVAANLNIFTRRSASPGSLYAYIVRGLGPGVGVISGWALVLAYVLTAAAVLCGFVNYGNVLLELVGVKVSPYLLAVVGAGAAWFISYKDIKLSTKIMLALELVSLALIVALALVVVSRHGITIGLPQFKLQGVTFNNLRVGLVLAFFSFTCFESAGSLGDEARNPLRSIPSAITRSVLLVGGIFVLLSYAEVLGFVGSKITLDKAEAPLALLANTNGVPIFGTLISIGALVSFWASILGCVNAGSRVLFQMSRHGVFSKRLGTAHETNKTPHVAVTVAAVLAFAVPAILIARGGGLFDIYGWVGTIATFGFLLVYALITLAAPFYLKQEKQLKPWHIVLSAVTLVIIGIPLFGSVYPLPAPPYNLFPFIFVGWLTLGIVWFQIRRNKSDVVSEIQSDIEETHRHFRDVIVREGGEGI